MRDSQHPLSSATKLRGTSKRRLGALALLAFLLFRPAPARAQSRDSSAAGAFWAGMMTDTQIDGPWSLWVDAHYNTRAFAVLRAGVTRHFDAGPSVTLGYGHLWTQPGGFARNEHRPWGQLFFPFRFSERFSVSHRLRFDLRVRQRVDSGAVVEGWVVVPRWRSQTALNTGLGQGLGGKWFVSSALEVLVNGGGNAGPNFLDQNRISGMVGWRNPSLTIRAGYLHRFVPGTSGLEPVHEHNAVVWVSYRFRRKPRPRPGPASPEAGNP